MLGSYIGMSAPNLYFILSFSPNLREKNNKEHILKSYIQQFDNELCLAAFNARHKTALMKSKAAFSHIKHNNYLRILSGHKIM